MRRSRLNKRLEKKTKRNLIISVILSVVILGTLFKFGLPVVANLAVFVSGLNDKDEDKKDKEYLAAPFIDTLPDATNSAQFKISGSSIDKDVEIEIYMDNSLDQKEKVDEDGSFSFTLDLSKGENTVKARAIKDDTKSDFTNDYVIIYIKDPPKLDVSSPSNNQEFKGDDKRVNVTGVTDSDVTVTVNEFQAVVDGSNNFSYELNLKDGDNKILIVAVDQAGNKTEKEINVKYSQ